MTTAYLDTVLIVGLAKSDLAPAELAAMFDLLELHKGGSVGLRTSPLAKEELSRHATSGRNVEEAIYMLLEDLPVVQEQFATAAMLGSLMFGANAGPIVKDELLGKLAEIGLQEDDARHVFQAARNDIDYFVTCDERTILRHAALVEAVAPIKLRLPSQLAAEFAAAASS